MFLWILILDWWMFCISQGAWWVSGSSVCSPCWSAGGAREGVVSLSAGQAGGGDGGRSQSAQGQGQRNTQQFHSSAFCTFGFLVGKKNLCCAVYLWHADRGTMWATVQRAAATPAAGGAGSTHLEGETGTGQRGRPVRGPQTEGGACADCKSSSTLVKSRMITLTLFWNCESVFVRQVSGLSQEVADLQVQQGRLLRDKSSLTKQLEDVLSKLTNQEQDNAKVHCLSCLSAW